MKQFVYLALTGLAVGFPLFAAIDITGTWEMTMPTPRGEMKIDVVFVQSGEIWPVTLTRSSATAPR